MKILIGLLAALGLGVGGYQATNLGDTGTVNTLNPWKVTSSYIQPRNATNGLQVNALANCNTIDTDADGKFACGTDEGGTGGSWSTSTADYWAQNDLKLQELSDVQDPNAWGQLLMWTGSVWATTSTSSLGIAGTADGNWSTTSADYWETQQTARTADDLSNNTTSDLAEGTNLYWTSARGTTSFNTLFAAGTVGWDTNVSDDWSTTSSDYWETQQTARTADDLSNNTTSDLSEGTNLYWTSARGTTSFNTLFSANTSGWDTSSADDMATTSPWTVGQVAYVTNNRTLSSAATGTLTEGVTGLEFTATGNLIGSAAVLNLTTGYSMFLTASGTNWNTFYNTPSNRITDGNGLTWSGNTLNFDGGDTPGGELGGTWASPTLDANALSLEELSDVNDTITETLGDLLYWTGTQWSDIATSSLNISTTNLVEGTKLFYTDARVGAYITGSSTLYLGGDLRVAGGDITLGSQSIFSGGDTASLNNVDAIDATTEATFEAALDTFNSGLTVGSFFALVNGASPTVDAVGEMALDTTDDQLIIGDSGGTARVFATDEWRIVSVTVASTSVAFTSGQTLPAFNHKDALEFTQFKCYVVGGTSKVLNLTDGTNDTETITCNTTDTSDTDVATNDTFTAGELGYLEFGATTGTVNYVHFEAYARITRE